VSGKPKAFLLGLQPRFVPLVKDGSKTHTIRGERKDGKRPQPGDMITIYCGLRTRACAFVLRAPCLRTEDVEIIPPGPDFHCPECGNGMWHSHQKHSRLMIAGVELNAPEADLLAWTDGFRCNSDASNPYFAVGSFALMMQFWDGRLPFSGWITHWDYSRAEFERVPVNHGKDLAKRAKAFIDAFETLGVLVP
jgi:hypothetical protein